MEAEISHTLMMRFSGFVAETMGLHFPESRLVELQRGVVAMAEELGFSDAEACIEWLMSAPLRPAQLETLAGNLTVGETYFFREPRSFEILADCILPNLLASRELIERPLRIWSAACCTGEEPYSIAITLRRTIAEWQHLALLATDINPRFLHKASAGVFGQWSFRAAPPWLKETYFRPVPDGRFEILPEIRRMVRFSPLNLVDDVYPSPVNDTHAMDVIFCRNVLMYFTVPQAQKVIAKLYRAQADGGWLIVGPSEVPQLSSTPYASVNFDGAIVYRKESGKGRQMTNLPWQTTMPQDLKRDGGQGSSSTESLSLVDSAPRTGSSEAQAKVSNEPERFSRKVPPVPSPAESLPYPRPPVRAPAALSAHSADSDPYDDALLLHKQGNYAEAVDKLKEKAAGRLQKPAEFGLLARALANQGNLHNAIDCCDRWVAADKLNPASHYLRAVILQERGAIDDAAQSLRKALYLDPRFVLAHFAMGNIARDRGQFAEARKHLEHALELSAEFRPDEVLPESEGVTAGRFAGIIRALIEAEAVT